MYSLSMKRSQLTRISRKSISTLAIAILALSANFSCAGVVARVQGVMLPAVGVLCCAVPAVQLAGDMWELLVLRALWLARTLVVQVVRVCKRCACMHAYQMHAYQIHV